MLICHFLHPQSSYAEQTSEEWQCAQGNETGTHTNICSFWPQRSFPLWGFHGPFSFPLSLSLACTIASKYREGHVPLPTNTECLLLQGSDSQKPKVLFRVPPKVLSLLHARTHTLVRACCMHACRECVHMIDLFDFVLRFLPPGFYYYSRYISTRGPFFFAQPRI